MDRLLRLGGINNVFMDQNSFFWISVTKFKCYLESVQLIIHLSFVLIEITKFVIFGYLGMILQYLLNCTIFKFF